MCGELSVEINKHGDCSVSQCVIWEIVKYNFEQSIKNSFENNNILFINIQPDLHSKLIFVGILIIH